MMRLRPIAQLWLEMHDRLAACDKHISELRQRAETAEKEREEWKQRAEDAELVAWGLANNYIMSVGTTWELRIGDIRERMYVGRNEIPVFSDDAAREALKKERDNAK